MLRPWERYIEHKVKTKADPKQVANREVNWIKKKTGLSIILVIERTFRLVWAQFRLNFFVPLIETAFWFSNFRIDAECELDSDPISYFLIEILTQP